MTEVSDDLYPLAVLIDELKNDDVQSRLNSISRITTIALALGEAKTRSELLPYLQDCLDDEDEILVALAEELGGFVPLVGGSEYAHTLLPILESLAGMEETVVRDKAVSSIILISPQIDAAHFDEMAATLVRLAQGEWFTSRCSATSLFSSVYPHLDGSAKADLRKLYAVLCRDDTPMVRRAAASKLKPWRLPGGSEAHAVKGYAEVVEEEFVKEDIVPLFQALMHDDQDTVRCLATECSFTLACLLSSNEDKETLLVPSFRQAFQDKSWRVRSAAAEQFVQVQDNLGSEAVAQDMTQYYVRLLKDPEATVRSAAANGIPDVCKQLSPEMLEGTTLRSILGCVKDLVVDPSQHVRTALAGKVMLLAPIVGKQHTIETLLPVCLQLLRDEVAEVRLNVLSKVDAISQVVGVELLSQTLLPAITELAEDRQWRVRLAIIEHIPLLARQLGREFFDGRLLNLCLAWLADCVYSIREAATENLRKLIEIFGVDWAAEAILPKVLGMSQQSNYLHRMTTLFCVNELAPLLPVDLLSTTVLPVVEVMAQDQVANVRFNVAKTLQLVAPLLDDQTAVQTAIVPVLLALQDDEDRDVKYFAQKALMAVA